jgi:hypothetical protein
MPEVTLVTVEGAPILEIDSILLPFPPLGWKTTSNPASRRKVFSRRN